MFQLNDQFLEEMGLGAMPAEQKQAFLTHIRSELESRVGPRLSEGLSESQLTEFEGIIDHNKAVIESFLARYAPDYTADAKFQNLLMASGGDATNPQLIEAYAATKWLEVNRPDYPQVVAATLDEIKSEIVANRSAFLGQ
ncbi:hypothetical protein FJZ39_01740 [Candidatus Saccharibacteria bacterium]|nr:hypothetical protein [Candidatus Saccharibacteria bacterium]